MRLHRFTMIAVCATFLAMLYVHQQVELIKSGYQLQQNRRLVQKLARDNSKLHYKLAKIESPKNLLASMQDSQIQFARRRGSTREHIASISGYQFPEPGRMGRLMDIFTADAEAATGR